MPPIESGEHFKKLRSLVLIEEAEEIETFRKEFYERTPEEREQAGKTLRKMVLFDRAFDPAGHTLLRLARMDKTPLPFYTFEAGDVVTLSTDPPEGVRFPFGTVFDRDETTVTVAFNKGLPDWVDGSALMLNKSADSGTYRKMLDAIEIVADARHGRIAYLRGVSFGERRPQFGEADLRPFTDTELNEPQKNAVRLAAEARTVALIHGPPGTGKTRALVEIICQAVARGERVLATAPSNVASDNLLEQVAARGVPVMRLGHPARIHHELRDHSLDHQLARHAYAQLIEDVERELDRLYKRRRRRQERGLWSREENSAFHEDVSRLKMERKTLRAHLFSQVLDTARVIVGTHVSGLNAILRDIDFDLVVLDEASQAVEPLSWIPILRGKTVILAGDHHQLPPTVRSPKAEQGGLGVSLFERFMDVLPEEAKILLTVQYRMHADIMGFSSAQFYENRLVADASVAAHTLDELPGIRPSALTKEPFLFIDTAGCGFEEMGEPGSRSRFNPKEAEMILRQLALLTEAGLDPARIALISPYSGQVRYLASKYPSRDIEIDSVDGFQGREKEAVLVSLVRSNLEGELGFLVDKRRMNVALTRARRKLIVIGDSATLGAIPFYRDFIAYAESVGGYKSAWDYGE